MTGKRAHSQAGFTLVELMIALVISLLLLAGILQILLSNRQSFGVQQTAAGLQENSRLVSFILENVVAHAGYRVNLSASDDLLFPKRDDSGNGLPIAAGAFVSGRDGGSDANDAVRLRFQAAGGVHDCAGGDIGGAISESASPSGMDDAPKTATADFALLVEDNTLKCVLYPDNSLATGNAVDPKAVSIKEPLVDGVDRFKVRYGLDSNGDDSVDTYANQLSSAEQAKQVRSLRIQLLLHSKNNVSPRPVAHDYTFLDGNAETFTDRRARELLDQTVALRNVLP